MPDWDKAINYLAECEKNYTEIGSIGYFALTAVVRPLRDRINNDERTVELFNEIMELK